MSEKNEISDMAGAREIERLLRCKQLKAMSAEIQHLQSLLNPRMWTKEMHEEWHRKIPDVQAAFDALRSVSNSKIMKFSNNTEKPVK